MRIGLITGEYPPDQGGVGDFTRELGRALFALGHEIHVITTADRNLQSAIRSSLSVHRSIPNWRWGCWRQIQALATELQLDMLNLQYQTTAYGMHPAINLMPRHSSPPVVVTFHDLKVPYLFPKAGPLRWQVVYLLARRANGVILTNREDFSRLETDIPTKRLNLIPIGSNIFPTPPPDYDRDTERAHWGTGSNDLLLGYFGFLNESKGGEELMQALALLVKQGLPVRLLMIGGRVGSSDPANQVYAERVGNLISELGIEDRVHWTGYATPEIVSGALLAADACILPYRDGVSFRRGTLHACLVHSRPIVTTRPAVPMPEIQDGKNMLLATPQDPQSLAEAVSRLASNPALQRQLEAGAAALAKEFTWERIARQTAAFFGRLREHAAA